MTIGGERIAVQDPLIRHAGEAGWEYLPIPNHGKVFGPLPGAYLADPANRDAEPRKGPERSCPDPTKKR